MNYYLNISKYPKIHQNTHLQNMKFQTRIVDLNDTASNAKKQTASNTTSNNSTKPLYCLEMTRDLEVQTSKANKSLLVALDISGSMSGSAIEHGKKGVLELANQTTGHINFGVLYTYNTGTSSYPMGTKEFESKVNSIRANSSTSFCSIFDTIRSYIENMDKHPQQSQEAVCVVFMTDGCETVSDLRTVMQSLTQLHNVCQGKTVNH